jgi:hypothetical protein
MFLHQPSEKLGEMFVTGPMQLAQDRLALRPEKVGRRPALAVGAPVRTPKLLDHSAKFCCFINIRLGKKIYGIHLTTQFISMLCAMDTCSSSGRSSGTGGCSVAPLVPGIGDGGAE